MAVASLLVGIAAAHQLLQRLCFVPSAGSPFYQLRQSSATLLLQLGVPLEQIRQIMGRAMLQMTLGYAQVSEKLQRDAPGRLDRWLDDTRSTARTTDSPEGVTTPTFAGVAQG